ncbi:hypothetical protein HK098_006048 [Nowakowskiella sp. JEL0407]|nr:hypothetical protein HK098_006048 [Nowakowskiella sp. JEL0407]
MLSGFRRDDVETALKDIVHGFFKVLKRGGSIILPFGNLGKLILKQKEVRIKFYPEFIVSALSEISQSQEQESNDKDEVSTSRPQTNQEKYENSTQNQPSQAQPQKSTTNSFPNSEQPSKPDKKADQNEKDQDPQFFLGFSMGVHTHPHSGDRLWTDAKCPVCRQSKMPVIELKEQIAKKDKENDRLLLNASLSNDSEYLRRTKEFELSKLKTAIATAQYNHTKAMEREFERKREIRNLPMGDLYENRAPPPNRVLQNKLLSEGIKEQIATKAKQKNEERVQKEINDRNFNKMFIQEMEQSKIQAHLEKLSKQAQLRESLLNPPSAVHPQSHTVLAETSPAQTLNSFARSESLMFLYKREKAKQLYREQLAIVEQKKLWEKKCLEIERMGELERLANSRKELEKDMKTIKQANFEARSSLEAYWSQQVALKKKLFAESAMNE